MPCRFQLAETVCEGGEEWGTVKLVAEQVSGFSRLLGFVCCRAKMWCLLVPAEVLLGGSGFCCQMDEGGSSWGPGELPAPSSSSLRNMRIHPQAGAGVRNWGGVFPETRGTNPGTPCLPATPRPCPTHVRGRQCCQFKLLNPHKGSLSREKW